MKLSSREHDRRSGVSTLVKAIIGRRWSMTPVPRARGGGRRRAADHVEDRYRRDPGRRRRRLTGSAHVTAGPFPAVTCGRARR